MLPRLPKTHVCSPGPRSVSDTAGLEQRSEHLLIKQQYERRPGRANTGITGVEASSTESIHLSKATLGQGWAVREPAQGLVLPALTSEGACTSQRCSRARKAPFPPSWERATDPA